MEVAKRFNRTQFFRVLILDNCVAVTECAAHILPRDTNMVTLEQGDVFTVKRVNFSCFIGREKKKWKKKGEGAVRTFLHACLFQKQTRVFVD